MHRSSASSWNRFPRSRQRASLLVTALLLSTVLGIGLVGYLALSRTALQLAHRTLFTNDATNLAETGLEEALYAFAQFNAGVAVATAWSGWTISGSNAMRTLPPFNRDQNAIGTVKVYVQGYDGSDPDPYVISQATITPLDRSPPIVKIIQINLGRNSYFSNGLVGINGLTIARNGYIASYHSNPSNSPTGPWARYTSSRMRSGTSVVVRTGHASINSDTNIRGDLYLGPNVTPPRATVSGTTYRDFNGVFPLPIYPTDSSVTQSSTLNFGSVDSYRSRRQWWWLRQFLRFRRGYLPLTLPESGDLPASDGRYYYFCDNATIANVTISPGANVTIVGTNTNMTGGLVLQPRATLQVYIDGPVNMGGWAGIFSWRNSINSGDWAGALRIFTSTTQNCSINTDNTIYACLYAPNATISIYGGWGTDTIVGSFVGNRISVGDDINFIYDEALATYGAGRVWSLKGWSELNPGSDAASLRSLTNSFLP